MQPTLSSTFLARLGGIIVHLRKGWETILSPIFLQKAVLDEDRRAAVSGEAVRLYREEPDLFMAASKEYSSNYFVTFNSH